LVIWLFKKCHIFNMHKKFLMTTRTKQRLDSDLIRLKNRLSEVLLEMGDAAKNNPDLRENFAYMESERDSEYIKGRIMEIREKIAFSKIINPVLGTKKIKIGSKVTIKFLKTGEKVTYTILGEEDALTKPGEWLNYKSRLGQVLLDRLEEELEFNDSKIKVLKIH